MTYEGQAHGLPEGAELLGGKFRIDQQIGSGGFGITYLAEDIFLERSVVIKECFSDSFCFRFGNEVKVRSPRLEAQYRKTVEMFMREARSIAKLRHPNIVSVHFVFQENDTAYMVLDLINGRDLMDIIESGDEILAPDQVHEILVKILDAIDLVHRHDLLHRDISPDNILLDKWGSPALIDFGAAREDASKKGDNVSTLLVVKDGYSPHEFYVSGGKQGPYSDLYALAATFYHLISGEAPPDSQTRVSALTTNEPDPYQPLQGRFPQYEKAFLEAIDTAMNIAPKDRLQSAKQWLSLIEEGQKKVRTVQIPETKSLTKTLSELIEETNRAVLSQPREPVQAQPLPQGTAAPKPGNRPAWVEEFNRETQEFAEREREEKRKAAQEVARRAELARIRAARQVEEARQREARLAAEAEQIAQTRGLLDWVGRSRLS